MMRERQPSMNGQTLLGAIRQKETGITRDLAAARDAADKALAEAKEQAEFLVSQAAQDGRQAAEAARQAVLQEIEQEAAAILAGAGREADTLRSLQEETLADAVAKVMNIVTGAI